MSIFGIVALRAALWNSDAYLAFWGMDLMQTIHITYVQKFKTNAKIEYYDDEELDQFAGIAPEDYTPAQHDAIRAVFSTLQESDVPGWCRSLQLRNIALPADIREEALLIVMERRKKQL